MVDAFVGIDVAFTRRKRLPVSICTWRDGRLVPLPLRQLDVTPPRGGGNKLVLDAAVVDQFANDAVAYVEAVARHHDLRIVRVAIDAPIDYCRADVARRESELALDRAGISCFATPTAARFDEIRRKAADHLAAGRELSRIPHSNQLWMLAGFALFRAFEQIAECREVYPQATVQVLGAGAIYKADSDGLAKQLAAAARYTGWNGTEPDLDDIAHASGHDKLDSFLAAWVAALPESKLRAFGAPPHDVIWVPKVDDRLHDSSPPTAEPKRRPARTSPSNTTPAKTARPASPRRSATSRMNRPCPVPGCDKVFFRYRGGWDGHAGSLRTHPDWHPDVTAPENRRALFRTEFADWFRD